MRRLMSAQKGRVSCDMIRDVLREHEAQIEAFQSKGNVSEVFEDSGTERISSYRRPYTKKHWPSVLR